MLTKEEVIGKILTASNAELAKVEAALTGTAGEPQDRKMLNIKQAADALNVSKQTIRRLVKEGRLIAVETRLGRKRILNQSITDLVNRRG